MIVVSDSSPLIALAAIHSLDLLHTLYGTVHIPTAVYREVRRGKQLPGAAEVVAAAWIHRHSVKRKRITMQPMRAAGLDEGESEAIALALELDATLIILDDREARTFAVAHGLAVTGTVGILIAAKAVGLLAAMKPSLDALISSGVYIGSALYREALRQAGE